MITDSLICRSVGSRGEEWTIQYHNALGPQRPDSGGLPERSTFYRSEVIGNCRSRPSSTEKAGKSAVGILVSSLMAVAYEKTACSDLHTLGMIHTRRGDLHHSPILSLSSRPGEPALAKDPPALPGMLNAFRVVQEGSEESDVCGRVLKRRTTSLEVPFVAGEPVPNFSARFRFFSSSAAIRSAISLFACQCQVRTSKSNA